MATADQHAHEPRHCTVADLFTISGEDGDEKAALIAASDKYLSAFAAPVKDAEGKPVCFHCGERIDGFGQVFGTAVAYQWGLAHGEANCSGCGWPARGMHYPKDANGDDLWSARNLFLAYHPDFVERRSSEAA
jgi:hypothetical protein